MRLKQIVKQLIPPAFLALRDRSKPAYLEFVREGWKAAAANYNDPTPAQQQVEKYQRLLNLRLEHTLKGTFESNERTSLQFAALTAAFGKSELDVLDFGGAIGLHYHFVRKALPESMKITYDIVDLPEVCKAGREHNPAVNFYENVEELPRKNHDLVIASSVLQYFKDWRSRLGSLASAEYFYLAKAPTTRSQGFSVRQNLKGLSGYLLFQVLRDAELRQAFDQHGYRALHEFVLSPPLPVKDGPSPVFYSTILFKKHH